MREGVLVTKLFDWISFYMIILFECHFQPSFECSLI